MESWLGVKKLFGKFVRSQEIDGEIVLGAKIFDGQLAKSQEIDWKVG